MHNNNNNNNFLLYSHSNRLEVYKVVNAWYIAQPYTGLIRLFIIIKVNIHSTESHMMTEYTRYTGIHFSTRASCSSGVSSSTVSKSQIGFPGSQVKSINARRSMYNIDLRSRKRRSGPRNCAAQAATEQAAQVNKWSLM